MLRAKSGNFTHRSALRALVASIGLIAVLLSSGCSGGSVTISLGGGPTGSGNGSSNNGSNGPALQFGVQQKTNGCRPANGLPDSACTPGATFPNVTVSQICQSGYSSSVRNVPTSEKDQVYAEYGISHHATGEFEVDHLVSLELGGSNDIANLWPEAAVPKPGFHEKDKVENYLHGQVCSGAISLSEAQHEIATNWLAVYQRMGGG
jgi:hypothetical protein